jgi:xanthine phosphoribosyltransferase
LEALKDRIIKDGKVGSDKVLLVDTFLNHMVDTKFVYEIGAEFAKIFAGACPSKIVTVESSGIAIAAYCALHLQIPFVIAKKYYSSNLPKDVYSAEIYSYTKNTSANIYISKEAVSSSDSILIIDDFLAYGSAVLGLTRIINDAQAGLAGVGICIEKSFQPGANELISKGINLHSLVRIKSLEGGNITFMP